MTSEPCKGARVARVHCTEEVVLPEESRVRWFEPLALFALGALLWVFWNAPLLWPVKIVVVIFHELGHAVAAWLTGGTVVEIGLSPQQGGHTITQGGFRLLILNAGYLGSLIAGTILLLGSRKPRTARLLAGFLAAALLITAVLFVRPILDFGFAFTLLAALAFAAMTRWVPAPATRWVVRAVGTFSVLYALFDVRDDVFRGSGGSDAHMLAELTLIPAALWGAGWILAGIALVWLLRRRIL